MLEDVDQIEILVKTRNNELSEPIELYLMVAEQLEASNRHNYISRAKFIREQCTGGEGNALFDQFREEWNIWNFDEEILTASDFKRGFLWCFRDHSTSWSDNQKAKTWFLTSLEGQFARRYEFWICDKGYNECIDFREGSYKEILISLLRDGEYEVLCSPVFSKSELNDFIKTFNPQNADYTIEEIIENFIEANPNFED